MSRPQIAERWYHANKYSADEACEFCDGLVHHERWCSHTNQAVAYAFRAVAESATLSMADRLALHALGVAWI